MEVQGYIVTQHSTEMYYGNLHGTSYSSPLVDVRIDVTLRTVLLLIV